MAIEIKQLVIKSSITDDLDDDDDSFFNDDDGQSASTEELKRELLDECRRLFIDLFNEKGQR